jgi:hypothetical protein
MLDRGDSCRAERPHRIDSDARTLNVVASPPRNEQRERFIADVRAKLYSMTELCERYGISRAAGYKWVARVEEGGGVRRSCSNT